MVMSLNDSFRTSDTALAAYLVSEGYGTPEIEFNNGSRAFFVFSKDNPKIDTSINAWDTARARGNVVMFFQAYQTLLRRIRERY
jgi:hypothetical protein